MITKNDIAEASETIQNDLLTLLDGLPNEAQIRACQIVVDGLKPLKEKVEA
jgi:hypothetical protein